MADKNPFDDLVPASDSGSFDDLVPKSTVPERIADLAKATIGKGVIDLGESAVGLADIATSGAAGQALKKIGYDPKESRHIIDQSMSPAGQADAQAVADTKGFLPTVAEVASRPWYVANMLGESAPSIAGGGAVGRVVQKVLPAAGAVAGSIGEGALSAGSTAEQIRQDTGTLDAGQALTAAGSGALVAGIGSISHVAGRIGKVKAADIDTSLLAKGLEKVEGSRTARVVKGVGVESAEEMAQSSVEQAAQNLGTGKPIGEGVPEQAAIGGVAGAAMGGGVNLARGAEKKQEQNDPSVQAPAGPLQAAAAVAKANGAGGADVAAQPTYGGTRALIADAAQRNGVDPTTALVISSIETGGRFNADAQNPKSSANGMFQFMDATRKMFPEVTPEQWKDPKVQAEYGAKFIAQTNASLERTLGRAPTPGESYMGHLLGSKGARSLLQADPNTPVQDVVASYDPKRAAEIVRLNGMKDLTAGQAVEKWNSIAAKHAERLGVEQAAFPFADKATAEMRVRDQATQGNMLEVVEHPNVPGRFAALPPLGGDPNEEQPASKVPLIADLPRHDEEPIANTQKAAAPIEQQQAAPAADAAGLAIPGQQPLTQGASTAQAPEVVDPAVQAALQQELDQELRHQPGVDYNPAPSDAQKQAGNYKKAHETFEGSALTLENPIGSTRSGTSPEGVPWSVKMAEADYGYEKRTRGADSQPGGKPEQVDVFLAKERTPNAPVFVVDQIDPETGNFDEHKVIQGAATRERAQQIYESAFPDGSAPLRLRHMTEMTRPEYRAWLDSGTTETTPAVMAQPQVREQQAVKDGILPQTSEPESGLFSGVPEAAKYAADNGVNADPVATPDGRYALAPRVEPQQLTADDTRRVADLDSQLALAGFDAIAPLRAAPSPQAALAAHVADKAFGVKVVHLEPHASFSGVAYKDRVYLASDETHPTLAIAGHELSHTFEGTPLHDKLVEVFKTYGFDPDRQVAARQRDEQSGETVRKITKEYARNEVVADMNGAMWVDPKFWGEMASRDQNLFRQVAYKFMQLATKAVKVAVGDRFDASSIVSEVGAARAAIAQAWSDHLGGRLDGGKATGTDTPTFAARQGLSPSVSPAAREANLQKFLGDSVVREPQYHGTARDIKKFEPKQAGSVFTTDKPQVAEDFGDASEHWMAKHYLRELKPEQIAAAKEAASADIEAAWNKGDLNDEAIDMADAIANDKAEENGMAWDYLEPRLKEQMPTRRNTMPLYVRAERPFDFDNPQQVSALVRKMGADLNAEAQIRRGSWDVLESPKAVAAMKEMGHDSFYVVEGGAKNLAVFDAKQVKSATGNVGTFNRENADIRMSKAALDERIAKHLTPQEKTKMRSDVVRNVTSLFDQLPAADEMAAVAWAGKAKRGWYAQSTKALIDVFGSDAPRFAALLASMSPRVTVQKNLQNAAKVWAGWVAAGRPTDEEKIIGIMRRTGPVLPAWADNAVRALTTEDPGSLVISGPKVNSFMENLRGNVNEVTNDAWMAAFGGVQQSIFEGGLNASGTNPGKGSGYLAMSARVREAASKLTKLTGEPWSPMEVQETVWAWAKTLYELQSEAEGGYGAREILDNGDLRNELIAATPDFSSLLRENTYGKALRQAGYGERLDSLDAGVDHGAAGQEVSRAGGKASPFAERTQARLERKAADRLEQLRDIRARGERETRAQNREAVADFALSKLANQTIFEVAPDPRNESLKADWDALSNNAKWTISRHVARDIIHAASVSVGVNGRLRTQLGGYGEDSNPSMSPVFDDKADPAKIDALTRVLGSALSQQSMMRTSPTDFPGSFEMNAITVEYPKGWTDDKLHELYTAIRDVRDDKGEPYATGHTTAEGAMVILDDGSRIGGEELAKKIAEHLGEPFIVYNDTIHAAFPEAGDDNYGFSAEQQQGDHDGVHRQAIAGEAHAKPSLRETADQLREVAQRRLRQDIANGKARAAAAEKEVVRLAKTFSPALKAITVPEIKGRIKGRWQDLRSLSLATLGGRQIAEVYAPELPGLPKYQRLVQLMEAGASDIAGKADKMANDWGHVKDDVKLAELMHDATLRGIDPSKGFVPGDSEGHYRDLLNRWDALTPEAKAIYKKARDMYEEHYAQVRDAIRERIERAENLSTAKKSEMLKRMDGQFFDRVKGVYFPLARFGDYMVIVRDEAGKVASVNRAETTHEAESLRRSLKEDFGLGYTVSAVVKTAQFNARRDSVGGQFLGELFKVLDETGIGEDLQDDINQLVLSSMPDLSWAKHGIHRKGTAGFSQDARRAFAHHMSHGGRYLQRVRFGDKLERELSEMEKYVKGRAELTDSVKAQQVLDEVRKRHDNMMNPSTHPLSSALTSFGFIFHLGLSPATAIVNLTQTALVAYPVIGGKFGFARSASALTTASADVLRAKNDLLSVLSGDELRAVQAAVDDGTIDVTLAHDLAGIAQGDDSRVGWAFRPVMRASSFLFHHAERFNRQATFLAAYRLARASGADHDSAVTTAGDLTYASHFDYSSSNRPRAMQGNVARVVTQFKQYSENMLFLLGNNARLAAHGDKQAMKTLAGITVMNALAAGAMGMNPLVGPLMALASMLGSDDDEPWDAKVALQNYLADALGQKPAEVIMQGASRLTPGDISGRTSLDLSKMLFPDVNEALNGVNAYDAFVTGMLGPVIGGIGGNMVRGFGQMADGEYQRALESMMPSVLRGPIKAYRFGADGAKDIHGVPIKDEVSASGVAAQALGFRPSEVANAQEGRGAVMSLDRRLNERRASLMDDFAKAAMRGDDTSGSLASIQKWNETQPSRVIAPMHMQHAVASRTKRIAEASQGLYLPAKHRDVLPEGRFAVTE